MLILFECVISNISLYAGKQKRTKRHMESLCFNNIVKIGKLNQDDWYMSGD